MLPKRIDKYELLEVIAVGGQAEVYRGRLIGAKEYSKTVAVKKILSNISLNSDLHKLFQREAKMCALLDHPNVIHTFDFLQDVTDFYMVMEYIHGKNLRQIDELARKKGQALSIETCVFIISQASLGLDYAHQKSDELGTPLNIVHRDISPHNIMITYDGTVKVVDFGVAKVADGAQKTATGMLMGKLAYMSPEQANCQTLDCRTDIFSLGLSLYEILTGRRAYEAPTEIELLDAARNCVITPPSHFVHSISPELERIVMKSLEKARENRYVSAHEMAEDLLNYLNQNSPYSSIDLGFLMKSLCEEDIQQEIQKVKSLTPAKPRFTPTVRSTEVQIEAESPPRTRVNLAPIFLSLGAFLLIGLALWNKYSPTNQPQPQSTPSVVSKPQQTQKRETANQNPVASPPAISLEQLEVLKKKSFQRMVDFVWTQNAHPPFRFNDLESDVAEFVIARWNSSTSGQYSLSAKDSSAVPHRSYVPKLCRTSSGRGCGPVKLIGKAPFILSITPVKNGEPEFYINDEDCKIMGNNTSLTEGGGCKFEIPAGKHNIPIHLTPYK